MTKPQSGERIVDRDKALWIAIRRALLLAAGAIHKAQPPDPIWIDIRRALLLAAGAIEARYTTPTA